jgi:hypothetical protein
MVDNKNQNYPSEIYQYYVRNNITYRKLQCIQYCGMDKMNRFYGCSLVYVPFTTSSNQHLQPCASVYEAIYNSTQNDQSKSDSAGIDDYCNRMCPQECVSVSYGQISNSIKFPSRAYFNLLSNASLAFQSFPKKAYIDRFETFQRNVLKLKVYFEDMSHVEVTDSESMLLGDLLANVGGTLGLFLGISLLSFFEIGQLIGEILIYMRNKKRRQDQEK